MVLNRLGNKSRISGEIIKHFPSHKTYIELFFGAGGLFFNKPLADYNFLNDIDDDVFNLWIVLQSDKEELIRQFSLMPISESLLKHWATNKESEPIKKAIRFLMLSNFGYMGKPETLCFGQSYGNQKRSTLASIEGILVFLKNSQFMCQDFRDVLQKIQFRDNKEQAFVYADPPYLNTTNNYKNSFSESDVIDLFKILVESNIRFAYSEFDNPFVLEQAKEYNLNIIKIGTRQAMKARKTEILITNYITPQLSLF